MSAEGPQTEHKSLRLVTGRNTDWDDVARACVCFANGAGGSLMIGIEDAQVLPPPTQRIPVELLDRARKRIGELTVNVQVLPSIARAENGGEVLRILVERSPNVASTADGRYFIRVADSCLPILGDDVLRLANERPGRPWEAMETDVPRAAADPSKLERMVAAIRASDRVKDSVREKGVDELLTHYALARDAALSCLGVLLLGTAADRSALGTAPIVQAIKYDAQRNKINKWVWDDYQLSPVELVDAIWKEVPDFRESYEVADGLYRRQVPAYDEKVVRELLVNALVHRPYTQRGDIFLNLYPERLEVVNPGRLPLGVTPGNILHASRRRNEGLARIFHDLGLMEREGSGFDLMYDRLLSQGRPVPLTEEGPDSVSVTIQRLILKPDVMRLIADADARYQLTQRERITLGVLAQADGLTARELAYALESTGVGALVSWIGRLTDFALIRRSGRTNSTRYFVDPALLKDSGLLATTSLKRIEPHRLAELVREDLKRYPDSSIGEISARIGSEVSRSMLRRAIGRLVKDGVAVLDGARRTAKYHLSVPG